MKSAQKPYLLTTPRMPDNRAQFHKVSSKVQDILQGPPVPEGFAREIFAEVMDYLPQDRLERHAYHRWITEINPAAKHPEDFIRENTAHSPPAPKQLVQEILQPLVDSGASLLHINGLNRSNYKVLRLRVPEARSMADFVSEDTVGVTIFSYNSLREFVENYLGEKPRATDKKGGAGFGGRDSRVQIELLLQGPPVPPNFARDILGDVLAYLPQIQSDGHAYSGWLRTLNPDARSAEDFVDPDSPLPVRSFNSLRALALQIRRTHGFIGPSAHHLILEILQPLIESGISLESITASHPRYSNSFRILNHQATSLGHFKHRPHPSLLGSHAVLKALVQNVLDFHAAQLPPAPPGLVREILKPLLDRGIDLTSLNRRDKGSSKILNLRTPIAKTFADLLDEDIADASIGSYNSLRGFVINWLTNRKQEEKAALRREKRSIARTQRASAKQLGEDDTGSASTLGVEVKGEVVAQPVHTLRQVASNLRQFGFDGLYRDECHCILSHLAICGSRTIDATGEYIAGCRPGFQHHDPGGSGIWVIHPVKDGPTHEEWENVRADWGI